MKFVICSFFISFWIMKKIMTIFLLFLVHLLVNLKLVWTSWCFKKIIQFWTPFKIKLTWKNEFVWWKMSNMMASLFNLHKQVLLIHKWILWQFFYSATSRTLQCNINPELQTNKQKNWELKLFTSVLSFHGIIKQEYKWLWKTGTVGRAARYADVELYAIIFIHFNMLAECTAHILNPFLHIQHKKNFFSLIFKCHFNFSYSRRLKINFNYIYDADCLRRFWGFLRIFRRLRIFIGIRCMVPWTAGFWRKQNF